MQKNKKSKKNNINDLHEILDESSFKKLPPENKKYLKSLFQRLKKSSYDAQVYRKIVARHMGEEEVTLEPKVTIFLRKGEKRLEFPEIKKENIIPEVEAVPTVVEEEPERKPFEDEDIIEIVKIEYEGPQFIEVKPKEIVKEEEPQEVEIKPIGDEELTEWEPIEKKDGETPEWESLEEDAKFCPNCGAKTPIHGKFCPQCGSTVPDKDTGKIRLIEPAPTFIPVKKVEEEEESLTWEILDTVEESIEEAIKEEKYPIKREDKINVFKEIISIDDKTAVLLYDNGFTSLDELTSASTKDLAKIKGIKKQKAIEIKNEIDQRIKSYDIIEEKLEEVPKEEEGDTEFLEEEGVSEFLEEEEEPSFKHLKKVEEEEESLTLKPLDTVEESIEEVAKKEKYPIKREDKINVFKEIISIDNKTAVLLYDNGFTTIDSLKDVKVSVLTKFKGITKKLAKKIKKEIDKKIKELTKVTPTRRIKPVNEKKLEELIKEDVLSKSKKEPAPVELLTKTSEWEPYETIESEIFNNHIVEKEAISKIFKDIKSIDDETAFLLYENGFTSLDALNFASTKDLAKIKGIKRKKAIEIKKELEQKTKPYDIIVKKPTEVTKEEEGAIEFLEEEEEPTLIDIDKKILEQEEPIKTEKEEVKEKIKEKPTTKEDETKDVFKDIQSIDKKIAKLLIENGIDTIDTLKNKTIKDLTKIRGIKRKDVKQIKKEIEKIPRITDEHTETTTIEKVEEKLIVEDTDEWESFDEKKIAESDKREIVGFMHGEYTLYQKEIETKTGKTKKVRFFSKAQPEDGKPIELPKGYEEKENKKTGLPYLSKIKRKKK